MLAIILNVLALTAAIIMVFILNILPGRTKGRNLYLLILLYCLVVHLSSKMVFEFGWINMKFYAVIALSMVVSYGPGFYYYIRKFYGLKTNNYLKHIFPILLFLWSMFFIHRSGIQRLPQWSLNLYYSSVLILYFAFSIRIILKLTLSNNQKWMKTITIGFGGLIVLYIIESVWIVADLPSMDDIILINTSIYHFFCFIFLLVTIKQVVTNPGSFSNIKISIPYKHEKIDTNESELNLILSYVIDQKEYLNPEINRNVISEVTGISVHRISEIINSKFQKNFNEWINDHRIEEAKSYLSNSELSIKEIYFQAGFNSKSAFNNAFKTRTNKTPSAYRKVQS